MKRLTRELSALVVASLTTIGIFAAEPPDGLVTAALSPEIRTLLIQEMQAVAKSMGRIHTAIVSGDHVTVADEAGNIHDSFVLAQDLSEAQRQELTSTLPAAFVNADRAFHVLAKQLSEAGEQSDPDLERLWFQEMTRACQACHQEHAAARFPGLAQGSR